MSLLTTLGTGWSWAGAMVGAMIGLGLALVVVGLPVSRRPGLNERLEPYLRDTPRPSRLLMRPDSVSVAGVARILRPILTDLARAVERMLGGAASVRRRLQRAGLAPDVERFRAEQVVWGGIGALGGVVLGALAIVFRGASALPVVLLVVCFAGAGIVSRDLWLTRAANQRERRMLAEFPTIAELLALAVSAGEGATGALDRVCRLSRGELSAELGACLAEARAGANLPTALQGLADRTGLTSLSRFVDGIVVAAERGTPLAEVLRAQAQDVRESGRRAVMEEGGRKEIAMMVPNVNLYLSNSPGRAAQEEADNMSQMERTIRGTIAWKFAPIGDAIPGVAHRILDEVPIVDKSSTDWFDDGRRVGERPCPESCCSSRSAIPLASMQVSGLAHRRRPDERSGERLYNLSRVLASVGNDGHPPVATMTRSGRATEMSSPTWAPFLTVKVR